MESRSDGNESPKRNGTPADPSHQTYEGLRGLARQLLSRQRPGHTLQPTALVHEAYIRIKRSSPEAVSDPKQFYPLAARAMRSVLVDHARGRRAHKRRPAGHRVPLDDAVLRYEACVIDLLALDEALCKLEQFDPRLTKLVELRFFGGLGIEETAKALDLSARTVQREWQVARAWLNGMLDEGRNDGREKVAAR